MSGWRWNRGWTARRSRRSHSAGRAPSARPTRSPRPVAPATGTSPAQLRSRPRRLPSEAGRAGVADGRSLRLLGRPHLGRRWRGPLPVAGGRGGDRHQRREGAGRQLTVERLAQSTLRECGNRLGAFRTCVIERSEPIACMRTKAARLGA
jgi:hypothetical protein